jgi:hypothetical protein
MSLFHSVANGGFETVNFCPKLDPNGDEAIGVCGYRTASQFSPAHNVPTLSESKKINSGTLEKE